MVGCIDWGEAMTALDEPRIRRTAENATVPDESLVDGVGPSTTSDRAPSCRLREGHRVHAVVTRETEDGDPLVSEVYCADPHCDHHSSATVEETAGIDPDETHIAGLPGHEDESYAAVVTATLVAEFGDTEAEDTLSLTEIELETYHENISIPV